MIVTQIIIIIRIIIIVRIIVMIIEWHYLSNATCPMRPHLFYACFVVSGIITICCMIRHV